MSGIYFEAMRELFYRLEFGNASRIMKHGFLKYERVVIDEEIDEFGF
jgi:hypothetical protein